MNSQCSQNDTNLSATSQNSNDSDTDFQPSLETQQTMDMLRQWVTQLPADQVVPTRILNGIHLIYEDMAKKEVRIKTLEKENEKMIRNNQKQKEEIEEMKNKIEKFENDLKTKESNGNFMQQESGIEQALEARDNELREHFSRYDNLSEVIDGINDGLIETLSILQQIQL